MTINIPSQAPNRKKRIILLSKVKIRLITDSESDHWNEVISKYHYIGNANLTGRQLRYVVQFGKYTIALLSFSAPALALTNRDKWIGWDYQTRRKRIDLIIQNSRFLILPTIKTPNLASRILRLVRAVVADDWNEKYNFKPLIIESFVDRQFNGTSYLADNWTRLGETAGYSRDSKNFYIQNDSPKTTWCVELQKNARKILCSEELPKQLQPFERDVAPALTGTGVRENQLRSLFSALQSIPDPRGTKGKRHSIGSCLSLVICGMMAGCKSLEECATFGKTLSKGQKSALRMYIDPIQRMCKKKKRTSPSHSAICDLLNKIDPIEFEKALRKWQQKLEGNLPVAISIDGKSIRATIEKSKDGKETGINVISAIPHDEDSLFLHKPRLNFRDMSAKRPSI